jgi:YkoY family integral membrane protein
MEQLIQQILDNPAASLAIVGNLIIIESLLSVDNAAVLATMVMDLPEHQKNKALKYGIWGAYIFRGLAMIFASLLIQIWWLKPLGGLYLLYLVFDWWKGKYTETKEDDLIDKQSNWLYKRTVGLFGTFWSTVALVEFMDMAFSIDNVFAAIAFTPNIILICIGVFIGILAMRFVAQAFVKLMEKYPFLETSAFIVIGILGLKLSLSVFEHFYPESSFSKALSNEHSEIYISLITMSVFFIPLLFNIFFKKKHV